MQIIFLQFQPKKSTTLYFFKTVIKSRAKYHFIFIFLPLIF